MDATEIAIWQLKRNYDMPFLEIGMNVAVNGTPAKISGVSNSGLKGIVIDTGKEISFHPTWETCYFDKDWKVIKDYRTKKK